MGNLKNFLDPKTIAVIGAEEEESGSGKILMENLLRSRKRRIFPINSRKKEILGIKCYRKLSDIEDHIDLALILAPLENVQKLVEECGRIGIDGAIIVSADEVERSLRIESIEDALKEAARKYGIRIVGPNSLGIIRPALDLNASIFHLMPEKGGVAFLSQSAGMSKAFLKWVIDAHIGFSMFASLGSMVDVDFSELIDILEEDTHTRSIVIYMEDRIGNVKRFVSTAKRFARNKPIIILKPKKEEQKIENPLTYTSLFLEKDRIYDAVFKRLGVLRVREVRDLFNLSTVLHARKLPLGPRLLIITNAIGAGLMALNALEEQGGENVKISREVLKRLQEAIGPWIEGRNPINIGRDADEERYIKTIEICLKENGADGILVIYTPQGKIDIGHFGVRLSEISKKATKLLIVCLFGSREKEEKDFFLKNNIPAYETPEEAVRTYLYMYKYERNLRSLYETPRELSLEETPPNNNLRIFIRKMIKEGVNILTDEDSQRFLEFYGIPTIKVYKANTLEQALLIGKTIGFPVVMKISPTDTIQGADFDLMIKGISSEKEVKEAYEKLIKKAKEIQGNVKIKGVAIQKMLEKIDYEIILGAKKDEEFGSIILFGMAGVGLRIFKDFSVGLPPLNQTLAKRLMEDMHLYKMLQGYGGKPPADMEEIESIIVNFSNLIIHFPEIAEMDINPIVISNGRAYALDARIVIDKNLSNQGFLNPHIIITPYPIKYIVQTCLKDGRMVILRPIKPEDEPLEKDMLSSLSDETLRGRFFSVIKDITHDMLVKFCNVDYDREIAIVAEINENERKRIIGIGRLIIDPYFERGECAVVVHDEFQRKGLGLKLMDMLIGIGEEKKLKEIYAYVHSNNKKMLNLAKKLGFMIEHMPDDSICMIRVEL